MKKVWNWLSIDNNRKVLSFVGSGIAVIIAASWTFFTYFDKSTDTPQNGSAQNQSTTISPSTTKTPPNQSAQVISGTYVGISTEGSTREPFRISFTNKAGRVTGTYSMEGTQGTINGTIKGNTMRYSWQLGGYYGKGISKFTGTTVKGTWGYGTSYSDAGTLSGQRQ